MATVAFNARSVVAAGNLWKLSRLSQVLEMSERASVQVLVLKGAAFLGWLYRLDERPMVDVDLLIRPTDRGCFLDALAPHARIVQPSGDQGLLAGYAQGQFSVDFRGLRLDVHVHLLKSPWLRQLVPVDEGGLWARALSVEIAGHRALRLSTEDQLLHLVAHATFHHPDWGVADSHRIGDAVRLLRNTSIDWDLLCRLARIQRMCTSTWLFLASPAFSSLVPSEVLVTLRPGPVAFARIHVAAWVARAGDQSVGPVLLTDRHLGLLRALATILTPSADWLNRKYSSVPTTPERMARHYLKVGAYAIERTRRFGRRVPPSLPSRAAGLSFQAKVALAVRIWFWFLVIQVELQRHPLPRVITQLGRSSGPKAGIAPRFLGQAVVRALRIGRFQPRCLISALVQYRLLAEQGDRAELVIGLPDEARNESAHAWIEIGGADVGPPPGRGDHIAFARYS